MHAGRYQAGFDARQTQVCPPHPPPTRRSCMECVSCVYDGGDMRRLQVRMKYCTPSLLSFAPTTTLPRQKKKKKKRPPHHHTDVLRTAVPSGAHGRRATQTTRHARQKNTNVCMHTLPLKTRETIHETHALCPLSGIPSSGRPGRGFSFIHTQNVQLTRLVTSLTLPRHGEAVVPDPALENHAAVGGWEANNERTSPPAPSFLAH